METDEILVELNNDGGKTAKQCSNISRYVVYGLIAVAWGFLKDSVDSYSKKILAIIILLGVIYLIIDTFRFYLVAKTARKMHIMKKNGTINDLGIATIMNERSDWSFSMMEKLLWICALMCILLGVYVLKTYFGLAI